MQGRQSGYCETLYSIITGAAPLNSVNLLHQELRIIRAHEVKFEYDEPFYSQALGRALLALTQLTKLHLEISHNGKDNCSGDIEDWDWDYIAAEVSRMPQLRSDIL